jgi:hypothetical protein
MLKDCCSRTDQRAADPPAKSEEIVSAVLWGGTNLNTRKGGGYSRLAEAVVNRWQKVLKSTTVVD